MKKKEEGMSLDDAFSDDDNVEYAKPKPPKKKSVVSKKMEEGLLKAEKKVEELSEELNGPSLDEGENVQIKVSKPISQIKKGDKITVDSKTLEVDAHYVLIDHGSTKEMAIELFDPKTDKDYQIRYFSDQVERTMQFFELDEIIYNLIPVKKIEW